MTAWYSIEDTEVQERLLSAWPDAPLEREEVLGMILGVARQQVVAFGPALVDEDDEPIPDDGTPDNYVYAQLQQTMNLWNAGRVSSVGNLGQDEYTFTPRPLDKTIRGIIRPLDVTNVF